MSHYQYIYVYVVEDPGVYVYVEEGPGVYVYVVCVEEVWVYVVCVYIYAVCAEEVDASMSPTRSSCRPVSLFFFVITPKPTVG